MIFAYDFETTTIEAGTPDLLYITACGPDGFKLSMPIRGTNKYQVLCTILETFFLIPEFNKAQFIAWNGNGFDVYFIAAALLCSERWIMQPYLTASKAMRGMKVKTKRRTKSKKTRIHSWEFLDGISMTGIVNKTAKSFFQTFAPDLPKLDLNLDKEKFDYRNPQHIAYAERDSEALYKGMCKVQSILTELIEPDLIEKGERMRLKPTIGNLAINYFMRHVPPGVVLKNPGQALNEILNGPVKRGGYCWCQRQYTGPVWKYDINQAYAAAMRDAGLPCGDYAKTDRYMEGLPGVYEVKISRSKPSPVPFYYKIERDNVGRFATGRVPVTTWLTTIEIEHLFKDGWDILFYGGYVWDQTFNFGDVVTRLETLRATDKDGSSGPLGTMVKAIGNNAYGKTLEQLNGLELVLAKEAPEGFDLYDPLDECAGFIFSRNRPAFRKPYHLPQIGVFTTAHVRCIIRSAALLNPDAFLTADTDCTAFSEPMHQYLEIDKSRYGAWKVEAEGVPYIIVGKKVYFGDDGTIKAKGLRTKELSRADYEQWLLSNMPVQEQTQRNNFLKFISGSDMFRTQERKGTDISKSTVYGVRNGVFIPK